MKTLYAIFNAYMALILYPLFKPTKPLWLIGGHNAKLYTDNAKVFYEYILAQHSNIDIYWVIDKDAPAFSQIKGKKLIKGSIKSYLYFYHAKIVLFSDTLNSDIAPYSFILPLVKHFYTKTFKVYLSHGTIAFKKMPSYSGKIGELKKAIFKSYDLAIASSELSNIAMKRYGIKSSAIVIAGSARHDTLENILTKKKTILIAPTWRTWINDFTPIVESDFFQNYAMLLGNEKLLDYLKIHDITVHFYLHHMMHRYFDAFQKFENESVKILSAQTPIDAEIKSASMMITDYSSICSDFYYLKKPVLFFQFDQKRFTDEIGSEIDLGKDTFGEVSYDTLTLIDNIIDTIQKNYVLSPKQKEGEKFFIHFTDKNNSERIYDTICTRNPKAILCIN